MPAIGTELLLILFLLALNGLLAMSEMALVSSRKIRLQQRAAEGDKGAAAAVALASDPSRFLSTVQIGITAVGILAGALGGASLTREIERLLGTIPLLAPYREPLSFAAVVLLITYLSLVIGELVPKQVALAHAETIAARMARPMNVLSRFAAPVVTLLSVSTDAALRLLRVPPRPEDVITEDEIKLLIQQGTHSGVFEAVEQELMEGALDLGETRIYELMTPRPKIVWLDVEDPPEQNWVRISASPHTSFPVCEGDLDNVLGVVSIKQLWEYVVRGERVALRDIPLSEPVYVMELQPALKLFEVFQTPGTGLAMVMDERGSIVGVVTIIDLTQAIIGDAALLGRRREHQPVQRPDGSWLLDGLLPLEELKDTLGIPEIPDEDSGRYQSLGGFVFSRLGRMPVVGDTVEWGGWRFEVVDMDGRRIDKVLAARGEAALAS